MSNSTGNIFRLTTFGESHGPAIGGVVDGMPAGVRIDADEIQRQLDRRRPGQSAIVTPRKEADRVRLLSGVLDGVSTGTPIGFMIENTSQRSSDYEEMRRVFRPSHADYTYTAKYGLRDHRGGGRSSARETACRVVGGALAMQALCEAAPGLTVRAYTSQVGDITLPGSYLDYDLSVAESNAVRCPDPTTGARMEELIRSVRERGDTVGGVVTCVISGVPVGLGDPVFGKLQALLACAMLSINAAKGFDYGLGFEGAGACGSAMVDEFVPDSDGRPATRSNHSGGIQGGISNGQDIYMRVAFKPVATLLMDVDTVDVDGQAAVLHARGRHDPCVLPRAVPVVEAMAAMVILDSLLLQRCARI